MVASWVVSVRSMHARRHLACMFTCDALATQIAADSSHTSMMRVPVMFCAGGDNIIGNLLVGIFLAPCIIVGAVVSAATANGAKSQEKGPPWDPMHAIVVKSTAAKVASVRTAKKVATKVHDLVHPDSAGAVERRVQAGMARQAAREAKLARKEAKKAKLAALKAEWEYEKRPEVMAMRRRERKEEEARLYQERIERERREATEAFYRSEARRKEREEWYFDGTRLRRHKTDD